MDDNNKITIGFKFIDENGDAYESQSTVETYIADYDSPLYLIGCQLNAFLKQCGFYCKGDTILMKSVTEDEAEALEEYLEELRGEKCDTKAENHE